MKFCACCFDKKMKTMLNTFLLLIAGLLKESKRNTLLGCAHSDEFGTFNYVLHSTIEKRPSKYMQMFRGLFLKKIQTCFRTILKQLPKNTCSRLSCVKFMGRNIHQFSFYERFSKFLDRNIAKFSKICMGSTLFSSLRNRA